MFGLALVGALAGCTFLQRGETGLGGGAAERASEAGTTSVDGWTITVSVESRGLPPLEVSAGPPSRAARNDARPWIEHELAFRNAGRRRVRVMDGRTSAFVGRQGERRLLAADEGCGYAPETRRSPLEPGVCLLYLDTVTLAPHASFSRSLTLFQGLRGMQPLVPGTYVFEKPVRFRVAGERAGGGRHSGTLTLVYELRRACPTRPLPHVRGRTRT